jgi:hypothetical protein
VALQALFHERPPGVGAERDHVELQTAGLGG